MRAALTQIDSQLAELQREAAKAMRTTRGDYLTRQLERTELESLTPPLPRRALTALRAGGITTVADARWLSRERLVAIPGVGAKTIDALSAATVQFENEQREEAIRLGQEAGKPILARMEELRSSLPDRETVSFFITTVDRAQRIRAVESRGYRMRPLSDDQKALVDWLNETVEPAWARSNSVPSGQHVVGAESAQLAAWASTIGYLAETAPPAAISVSPFREAWESEKGKRWIIAGAAGVLGLIGFGLNVLSGTDDTTKAVAIEATDPTTTFSEFDGSSTEPTESTSPGKTGSDSEAMSIDEAAAAVAPVLDRRGDGSQRDTTTTAVSTTIAVSTTTSISTTAEPSATIPQITQSPSTVEPPTATAVTVAALADLENDPRSGEGCHPAYSGCVPIASEVDCAGGSETGPVYQHYRVEVLNPGNDPYHLNDDPEEDNLGCDRLPSQ